MYTSARVKFHGGPNSSCRSRQLSVAQVVARNTHVTDYLKSITVSYIYPFFSQPRAFGRNGDLFVAPIQHTVFVHVCIYLFKSVSYLGRAGPFNLTHSFHYPNLNPTRIVRRKPPQIHDSKTDPKILNLISEAFFLVAEI